jgi:hypothetical protein
VAVEGELVGQGALDIRVVQHRLEKFGGDFGVEQPLLDEDYIVCSDPDARLNLTRSLFVRA